MGNWEIEHRPEELRKQALKEGIVRKIERVFSDGTFRSRPEFDGMIDIDPGVINSWENRPFSKETGEITEANVGLYSLSMWSDLPTVREIYVKTDKTDYALTEAYGKMQTYYIYPKKRGKDIEREATLDDLEIFDKVMDATVSRILGALPWEDKLAIQERDSVKDYSASF